MIPSRKVTLNSIDRSTTLGGLSSGDYQIDVPTSLEKYNRFIISRISLPKTYYNIVSDSNTLIIETTLTYLPPKNLSTYIVIPEGMYTNDSLATAITNQIILKTALTAGQVTCSYAAGKFTIAKTTGTFSINFRDSTLSEILGFETTEGHIMDVVASVTASNDVDTTHFPLVGANVIRASNDGTDWVNVTIPSVDHANIAALVGAINTEINTNGTYGLGVDIVFGAATEKITIAKTAGKLYIDFQGSSMATFLGFPTTIYNILAINDTLTGTFTAITAANLGNNVVAPNNVIRVSATAGTVADITDWTDVTIPVGSYTGTTLAAELEDKVNDVTGLSTATFSYIAGTEGPRTNRITTTSAGSYAIDFGASTINRIVGFQNSGKVRIDATTYTGLYATTPNVIGKVANVIAASVVSAATDITYKDITIPAGAYSESTISSKLQSEVQSRFGISGGALLTDLLFTFSSTTLKMTTNKGMQTDYILNFYNSDFKKLSGFTGTIPTTTFSTKTGPSIVNVNYASISMHCKELAERFKYSYETSVNIEHKEGTIVRPDYIFSIALPGAFLSLINFYPPRDIFLKYNDLSTALTTLNIEFRDRYNRIVDFNGADHELELVFYQDQ